MPRLSATSLRTYRTCPQKWKLKYVDGHEEEDKPFFNLGSAVHAALEAFYDGRVSGPPPLEEVLEAFREEFDPEAYPDEEERERRRADGLQMVREFYEEHAGDFRPALAVEKRLDFEVEGVSFVGYVDRIDRTEDERLRVVDYKTGGSFDLDRVRGSTQLTLYQLGAEQKCGREVESLVLYHVPTQTPFEVDRHGEEQVAEVRSKIRSVARGIERESFFEETGRRAVAGDEFRVKASRREEWRVDDDDRLRRVLEPAGLWDRVLTPSWHEKKKLPEDDSLPEEIREQVREIGYRKVLWRLTSSECDGEGNGEGDEE